MNIYKNFSFSLIRILVIIVMVMCVCWIQRIAYTDSTIPCARIFVQLSYDNELNEANNKLEALEKILRRTEANQFRFALLEKQNSGILASYRVEEGEYAKKVLPSSQDVEAFLGSLRDDTDALILVGDIPLTNTPARFSIFRTYAEGLGRLVFKLQDMSALHHVKPSEVAVMSLLPVAGGADKWISLGVAVNNAHDFEIFNARALRYVKSHHFGRVVENVETKEVFEKQYEALNSDPSVKCIVILAHASSGGKSLFLSTGVELTNIVIRDCGEWNAKQATLVLACKAGVKEGFAQQLSFDLNPKNVISKTYNVVGREVDQVLQLLGNEDGDIIEISRSSKLEWMFSLVGIMMPQDDLVHDILKNQSDMPLTREHGGEDK